MRVALDVRPFLKKETGVGIYLKNLIWNLSRIDTKNNYYLFSSSLKDRFDRKKIPDSSNFSLVDYPFPVSLVNFLWNTVNFPKIDFFIFKKIDIVHSPHPLLIPTYGKCIITVHDLFFFKSPDSTVREMRSDFPEKVADSIEKADGIICPSQFTKSEIIRLFGCKKDKIKVIPHGVDENFKKEPKDWEIERVKSKYSLPEKFILFVGNIEPRKNLETLIEAFRIFKEEFKDYKLLIVGEGVLGFDKIKSKIEKMKLQEDVIFTGYVGNEELPIIYRLSSIFVFPSIEEGFGLPLLEAMACSVPVVASGISSIPEVAEDCAIYFSPQFPEEIAEKLRLVLQNETLRTELIRKGRKRVEDFSWLKCAERTLEFYREIYEK